MRRARESSAKGHGTPPLIVREIDPVDEHPSLGPLRAAKLRRAIGKARTKTKVKVEVDVKKGGTDAA